MSAMGRVRLVRLGWKADAQLAAMSSGNVAQSAGRSSARAFARWRIPSSVTPRYGESAEGRVEARILSSLKRIDALR